ncbi:MAG: hypothetical protein EXR85_05310 [Xanthomonadales bacterium]|nr:hypothetical protein [Xanthomonadales bacterium]
MNKCNGFCAPVTRAFEAGFTIIELAITLVMVAIGLALALPSLQNLVANNQVTAAANTIVSGLNLARSNAITSGENITICPVGSDGTCSESNWENGWIVFTDADGDSVADPGEIVRVVNLDGNTNASGFDDVIVFRSDGTTSLSANVTITNCYQNSSVSDHCSDVTVSAFGLIQSGEHAGHSSGGSDES